MTLTVVIPSHSRVDLLERCLRSVVEHAPAETQILVVDDGSRNAIVSECARQFPVIDVVRLESAEGFAVAANSGLRHASGEIVELLNDDTEVTAGWWKAIEAFQNPNVVAVAPLVLMHPAVQPGLPRIDSAGDDYDAGGFAFKRGHGEMLSERWFKAGPVWGVSAAAGFYRRQTFLDVGGFPEDFGAYFEDVDLSHRLNRVGAIHYFPESVVWHRVSASYGRTPSYETLVTQSRNEERVYWRNSADIRTLPRHALILLAKTWKRACEGTFKPWTIGRFRGILPMIRAQFASIRSK